MKPSNQSEHQQLIELNSKYGEWSRMIQLSFKSLRSIFEKEEKQHPQSSAVKGLAFINPYALNVSEDEIEKVTGVTPYDSSVLLSKSFLMGIPYYFALFGISYATRSPRNFELARASANALFRRTVVLQVACCYGYQYIQSRNKFDEFASAALSKGSQPVGLATANYKKAVQSTLNEAYKKKLAEVTGTKMPEKIEEPSKKENVQIGSADKKADNKADNAPAPETSSVAGILLSSDVEEFLDELDEDEPIFLR